MKSKVIESYKVEKKQIFNKQFGVIFNGEDNLKPIVVENLIDSSPTASQCAWLYERFLCGGGFEVDLSNVNLSDGTFPYTPNDLLFDAGEPLSRHQGVFVLVGYNANYDKDHYKIIPYSLCRLGKKDSKDYIGKILVSKNGWGKSLKKDEVDVFDTYNPRPEVIQAQVEAAGGWENYKGQIAFLKLSDKYDYPNSLVENCYLFADTEHQLGLYYNGTAKRGFEDLTFIRHRKFPTVEQEKDFYNNLKEVSGLENASSKMVIEDEWDDEREKTGNFKFDSIKNDIRADKYAHFESSSANFIRKAFKNIPPQLVDYVAGKLGNTSGEDLIKAQSVYNAIVARDQEKVEMFFKELFRGYKRDINPSGNWTIKQYSLLDDGTVNYNGGNTPGQPVVESEEQLAQKEIRTAQATLRGSVGGVSAVLAIQTSVANGTTSYDAGVAMLENIFGYSNEVAKKMLGEPKPITEPANPNPDGNPINN